jgi:hypothetical protein
MDEPIAVISGLLHEASETHHTVFRIVDGDDPDWASWYSDWLLNLSELPSTVERRPVRSELTYMLVKLDKDYTAAHPSQSWEDYYSERLVQHFVLGG